MADGIKELTEAIVSWKDGQDEQIHKLNKILLGNGEVGLCETVRQLVKGSVARWCVVGAVGLALVAGVITIILK
jgi:hypothetical protein